MERVRVRPLVFAAVAALWLAGWGWAVHGHPAPLWVDDRMTAILTVGKQLQDEGIRLLVVEGPAGAAVIGVVLAVIALGFRSVRGAVAVLVGVAAEVASVQWVIKPIVARHEIAPDYAFPSTHVGAVIAAFTAASLLLDRHRPVGWSLGPRTAVVLQSVVIGLGVGDVLVVCAAVIATGGHLFSDVVAVIPWGIAVPWLTFALLDPPALGTVAARRPHPRTAGAQDRDVPG